VSFGCGKRRSGRDQGRCGGQTGLDDQRLGDGSASHTATRITAPAVTATYRISPINRHGDVAIGLVGVGGLFNGGSAEPGSEPSAYPRGQSWGVNGGYDM
jgi:hypothetical protein